MNEVRVKLAAFSWEDAQLILDWRKLSPGAWQTPWEVTLVDHERWYRDRVCGDRTRGRYWGVYDDVGRFIGQTELVNIDWYDRKAEVGMIINPSCRREGVGRAALYATLAQGFDIMGLHQIWGRAFHSTDAHRFWERMVFRHQPGKNTFNYFYKFRAECCLHPQDHWWDGRYHDTTWFAFLRLEK